MAVLNIAGVKKGRFYTLKKEEENLLKIEELKTTVPISGLLSTMANTMEWLWGFGSEDNVLEVMTYVSTHTHSEYSILDSINKVEDLAETAVGAMALTDHGNMCGTLDFQKQMKKRGKHAILGCEVYMEKPAKENSTRKGTYHLILLAKTQEGLSNLTKIVSRAYEQMYSGRGIVTWELLEEFHSGIICTSACIAGEVAQKAAYGDLAGARSTIHRLKTLFGDDFYIEIQHHGFELEVKTNPILIQLAKEEGVKLIAGIDSHWLVKGQREIHDTILAINDKKTMTSKHRTFEGRDYHVLSQEEAFSLFQDTPEALQSTLEVARKCSAAFETGEYHTPSFDFIPDGFSGEVDYFKYLIKRGYLEKIINTSKHNKEYQDRLQYETKVILSMGYAAYFLIVNEYVVWAKTHHVAVGPGRGSAAGSLVAYCLDITDVDPLQYGLLFERFLNPDRVSMPDIDIDFEDSKRDMVINHIKELYGKHRVSNIVTFGKMKGRNAIKDVGRVYQQNSLASTLAGMIPKNNPKATINGTLAENPDMKKAVENEQAKLLIDRAMEAEGLNRNKSTHACGIVIAPAAVDEFIPTFMVGTQKEGYSLSTQFVCGEAEEIGLLKMDFLGLKTMGVLNETVTSITETGASLRDGVTSYSNIPLNDPYVYRDIAKGSSSIFQIESGGMQKLMKQLYADVNAKITAIERKYSEHTTDFLLEMSALGNELFNRLIAGVAMYRPGPMDFIPDYIKGMHNPNQICYDVPQVEPILKSTYGVIVYQEQVMEIVRELAGFSMAQADMVRKAMGKKKEELMAEYREYFLYGSGDKADPYTKQPMNIKGCVKNGISEEKAKIIWDKMKDFAKYAFNKSHACAYAMLSARCAWLRYYYPVHYMAANLSIYIDSDKLNTYLQDTKTMGIKILPPDINRSQDVFTVEGAEIRFGLKGLKGLNKSVTAIMETRLDGEFTSIFNFLCRTKVNKTTLTSLICAGAMDGFPGTRAAKISMVETWIKEAKKVQKKGGFNQLSFIPEETGSETPVMTEMPQKELIQKEKESSGLYITAHPLDLYQMACEVNNVKTLRSLVSYDEDGNVLTYNTDNVKIAGVVTGLKQIYTKKDGRPMAFFDLEDTAGKVPVVFFPDAYAQCSSAVTENECVCLTGKFQLKDGELQFIIDTAVSCDKLQETSKISTVYVCIQSQEEYMELEQIISTSEGQTPVLFAYQEQFYNCRKSAEPTAKLFMVLEDRFGRKNVAFR